MEEHASFERRAVLAPSRARRARLVLLLPVVALVVTAWAGVGGGRSDPATAEVAFPTVVAAPSPTAAEPTPAATRAPRPQVPAHVVGLDVERLGDLRSRPLGRDDVVAVSGWYVATAITNCPRLAAIFRPGALPHVRGDADPLAFCERTGILFDSAPKLDGTNTAGYPAVAVTIAIGVVVPVELEVVGADAREVVVLGRFVQSGEGCEGRAACRRELVVDHVAWTTGA